MELLDDFGMKQTKLRDLQDLLRSELGGTQNSGGFFNIGTLVRGVGLVASGIGGVVAGHEIGDSTPYPGGGTINENVERTIFLPFWNWWYGYKVSDE